MQDYMLVGWCVLAVLLGLVTVMHFAFSREEKKQEDNVTMTAREISESADTDLKPEIVKKFLETMCGDKRSFATNDYLTKFELQWMFWRIKYDLPGCPDCEAGELAETGSAAASLNLKCGNKHCGSRFLLHGLGLGVVRLSDRSPDKPIEMVSMGPHR